MSLDSFLSIHIKFNIPNRFFNISETSLQNPYFQSITASTTMVHLYISEVSTGSMIFDPYLNICSYAQDLRQDPHLSRNILIFQGPLQSPVSGSCLSIIIFQDYLQDLYLYAGSCLSIFVCQDLWQNSYFRIHVSVFVSFSGSLTRSTSPDSCLNIRSYLRIVRKIQISGSMWPIHILKSTKMDPLQNPSLRLSIPGSSAKSISPDPYISIQIYIFQGHPQNPYLWVHP